MTQEDALSLLLFHFPLEYAARKGQETNLGLDMNSTHQIMAHADDINLDINLIGDDIKKIKINEDVFFNACKHREN